MSLPPKEKLALVIGLLVDAGVVVVEVLRPPNRKPPKGDELEFAGAVEVEPEKLKVGLVGEDVGLDDDDSSCLTIAGAIECLKKN